MLQMKRNTEQREQRAASRRPKRGWRILAGLSLAATVVAGVAEANALTGIIGDINSGAEMSGLQPAVRLNPPKAGLGNHKAYMIGDSLTAALASTDMVQYAASKGWDLKLNGVPSRSLYFGCDKANPPNECAKLSDGITQINEHAPEIAKNCTFILWLGTNAPESSAVYEQKYAQAFNKVNLIWDEDPAQTCPVGQRRFMAVNMPTGGPRAPAGFAARMAERNGIVQNVVGNLAGATIFDMNGLVVANHLLDSSTDGVHAGFASARAEGHALVDFFDIALAA